MSLILRLAQIDDFPAITAIYRPAVIGGTASFELTPPDVAEMIERWQKIAASGYPYFVALRETVVVGFAYANLYRSRPAYRFTVENSLYVDERVQRQGVGLSLLQTLIVACQKQGFQQMIAVIGGSDNLGSIGVHTKAGFETVGVLKNVGFKFERWHDSVLMQRSLV